MISNKSFKKYLLENRVNKNGDLILGSLNLKDFDGDIYVNNLVVKKNIYQNSQKATCVFQSNHKSDVVVQTNHNSGYVKQGNHNCDYIIEIDSKTRLGN